MIEGEVLKATYDIQNEEKKHKGQRNQLLYQYFDVILRPP